MCIYIQWFSFFFWLNINLHIHRMKHHKAKKNQLQGIYRPQKGMNFKSFAEKENLNECLDNQQKTLMGQNCVVRQY